MNAIEVIGLIKVIRGNTQVLGSLGYCRLNLAPFIRRARLQHRLFAIPSPRETKPSVRETMNRLLKLGFLIRAAAVDGHFDLGHRAPTGPRESGDLVESAAWQSLAAGGPGDDGVGSNFESVPWPFPVRNGISIVAAFVPCHVGL